MRLLKSALIPRIAGVFLLLIVLLLTAIKAPAGAADEPPQLRAGAIQPYRLGPASAQAGRGEILVVRFDDRPDSNLVRQRLRTGHRLLGYLADDGWLVLARPVRSTAELADGPAHIIGVVPGSSRIEPQLAGRTGPTDVVITAFTENDLTAVITAVNAAGGIVRQPPSPGSRSFRARLDSAVIAAVADDPSVEWIEPEYQPRLLNDAAGGIMGAPSAHSFGLLGAKQTIAIADTGLDSGNESTLKLDFRGRLLRAYGLGRPGVWSDTDGHGTHVAGSALGNGASSGGLLAGVAPQAEIVFQSLLDDAGGLRVPFNLYTLFEQPYADGARIHTNSWGYAGTAGAYTSASQDADRFAWDHPDMLILFAAGNEGADQNRDGVIDTGSVIAPA